MHNRKPDGQSALHAGHKFRLKKRRDALLAARRRFEAPRPNVPVHKSEQIYAYGTSEW